MRRTKISTAVEDQLLLACRRRCCLCVYLEHEDRIHKGQIAHLNRNPVDGRLANLVWLCFNHHDEYDSRTSQSKRLTLNEVRTYRDLLNENYREEPSVHSTQASREHLEPPDESEAIERQYVELRERKSTLSYMATPWRFPLWLTGNRPEFFAYKAGNRFDGVCLIERIDLPDGRIVVVAIQTAGNPGNSITNCVEELCHQVCERFAIPTDRLVWLEHYDCYEDDEWSLVTFAQRPPSGPFAGPHWEVMSESDWTDLRLRPKRHLRSNGTDYESKIRKLFSWPDEAL